jgi:hypothetical protein
VVPLSESFEVVVYDRREGQRFSALQFAQAAHVT